MSRTVYNQIKTSIDSETGEIKNIEENKLFKTSLTYEFIRLNFNNITLLAKISNGELSVFLSIVKYTDYSNVINLNAAIKKEIASNLNKSIGYIDKCLTNIKKAGLMKRIDTGQFILNPDVLIRGKEKNVPSICKRYEAA